MPIADSTSNRVNFTIGRVTSFKCPAENSEAKLWDAGVKNLILRARPSGSKAYFYQGRLKNKMLRIKIGDASDVGITIEYAREKATEYQSLVNSGIDPRLEIKRMIESERVERSAQSKKQIKFIKIWNEYVDTNKSGWSGSHLQDHHKAIVSKGLKIKNSTNRTVGGILCELKNRKMEDFDSRLILNWINKEKLSRPTYTARGFRLLRACLNWADNQVEYKSIVDLNSLFKNKDIRRTLPKSKPKQDALERSHLPSWFEAVRGIDNRIISAYLQTALLTGARREEIASLTWDDVDFKWRSILIKDKVEGERTIPLTPYVAQLLINLPRRNEWIFSSPQAKSGRLQDPFKKHNTVTKLAGLPHITIHGLRRSFGSLSEWVECPVGIVAQIQGHKPSATAEKHYRVRPLDLLRLWHTKIEKQILEFGGIEQPKEVNKEPIRLIS